MSEDEKLIEAMARAMQPMLSGYRNLSFDGKFGNRDDLMAVARAALAVVRQAEAWRPVSEMPDDGRDVIMYSEERGMAIWPSTARWDSITYWRDAPAAPRGRPRERPHAAAAQR